MNQYCKGRRRHQMDEVGAYAKFIQDYYKDNNRKSLADFNFYKNGSKDVKKAIDWLGKQK